MQIFLALEIHEIIHESPCNNFHNKIAEFKELISQECQVVEYIKTMRKCHNLTSWISFEYYSPPKYIIFIRLYNNFHEKIA